MLSRSLRATTVVALLALLLAGCSVGGGSSPQELSAGLSAPMNQPGARLSRVEALFLLNDYRRSRGATDVRGDTVLDSAAQNLATQYAKTGAPPATPAGISNMRVSAGYTNFAETFSGWRNSPADAAILADPTMKRAGLAFAYEANSTYGVYWVLLLDD
jgi:uncharacterized protein YkwD